MASWLPFRITNDVRLDGLGNGSIRISPSVGEWVIEQVSASTTSVTNEPQFTAYINGAFIGGSFSGNRTTDTEFNQRLNAQEAFVGAWVGGDPSAIAQLTLTGRKLV